MTEQPGHGLPPSAGPAYPGSQGRPSGIPSTPPAGPAYPGSQGRPSGIPSTGPASPPPSDGQWRPARIDPVAGTEFGLVQLEVPGATSGLATGSLVAGIASVLISALVLCFGLVARRQIRRSGQEGRLRFTGRGTAAAGISCGAAGVGIALLSLALALVLQVW